MRLYLLIAVAQIAFLSSLPAESIRVVTRDIEPFSFERGDQRTGFAVELWERVARDLARDYGYTSVGTAKEMVEAVASDQADVALGALSITAEREKLIDFSQPFYESGLQILTQKHAAGITETVRALLANFISWQLLVGFFVALLVMVVISHLVWRFEHPVNHEMWPRSYLAGLGESLWWTVSIFLVGGADNKGPVGLGGRIVATVWMLASVIAVSLLTASLSAVLTVNSLAGDITGPGDLPGKAVATIAGSTSETWLSRFSTASGQTIRVSTFPSIPACLEALRENRVQAVVFDAPILKYFINKTESEDFVLVGMPFEKNNYGFGLRQDCPYREGINQILLNLAETGFRDELEKKWFGEESASRP